MTTFHLMLVDDHPIVRHGIAQLLARESDINCDLQADSADAALSLLRNHKVDLMVVDITMPGLSGLDLARRVLATWPDMPILVLSMHDETVYAERAFSAGARGYLTKQGATDRLVAAVRKLLDGGVYFPPALERSMLDRLRNPNAAIAAPSSTSPQVSNLNEREFEVLQMLAQGLSSQEMAERINRSIKSVEAYRASLRHKLGAKNVADLTRLAIEISAR